MHVYGVIVAEGVVAGGGPSLFRQEHRDTVATQRISRAAVMWWAATLVIASFFFVIAMSDTVYNLTSPPGPWQILLRKSYSVAAFAIVGFFLGRSLTATGTPKSRTFVAVSVAAYSTLIEVAQAIGGAQEGLGWNAVDVACGLVGGYLGAIVERIKLQAHEGS